MMMKPFHWFLIFLLQFFTNQSNSIWLHCTERFMDFDLIKYRAERINISRINTLLNNQIRILTEYQFNCSTNITSVIVGGDLRRVTDSRHFFPSVQIWRPQVADPNQYNLVPDSERTIYYSTNNVSTNGVFEYPLDPPIPVQSGNRLAISQPPQGNSTFRVYYIQGVIKFDSHTVSFGSTTANLSGSPINGDLVLVYPITDGACVSSLVNTTVIKENALLIHEVRQPGQRRQFIYPEMKFSCNGSVIKWIYGAVDQNRSTGDLPELQIWRQTGLNSYNKQGSSLATANISIAPNVYEYYPVTPLEFQEGDIFGVHTPQRGNSQLLLYEQRVSGPLNLRINSNVDSPAPSTINSMLRTVGPNDFPLVTIIINTMTSSVIFPTKISSTSIIETSGQFLTLSEILSNEFRSTSTIETSTQLLTTSEMLSNKIRSTSTIETSSQPLTLSEIMYIKKTTTSVISSILLSPTNVSSSTSLSVVTLSSIVPTLIDNHESVTTIMLVSSSPFIHGGESSKIINSVPAIAGVVCSVIVLLTIVLISVILIFIKRGRQKRRMDLSRGRNEMEFTMTNQLYMDVYQEKPVQSTGFALENPTYTGCYIASNNDKEKSNDYNDVFYDYTSVTSSPPPYDSLDYDITREPSYESRQASNSILNVVPNTLYASLNQNVVPKPTSSVYNNYKHDDTLQQSLCVPTPNERSQIINSGHDNNDNVYDKLWDIQKSNSLPQTTSPDSKFEVEQYYWEPETDINSIYQQLSSKKYREILRQQIEITSELGSGQFGIVAKGKWQSMDVAIKTLKNDASEEDKVKFLQEAAIMGQFHHPNIVKLYGVVTVGEPIMIVLELISGGDLRHYLNSLCPKSGEAIPSLLPIILLSFCRQIASGMEYLSKKCFVHRDLAARNILVTEQGICKIADFGMSRDLQDENYYISHALMIPIKWTAPEALHFKRYSTASDVWSFGVVLYEVWSLGHKPFENHSNEECLRLIDSGYRLPPPPGCPRPIYKMMIQCWHPETSSRPTFVKLVSDLSQADVKLLSSPLSNEDKTCSSESPVLGGSLDTGHNLYIDLQRMYM